MNALTAIAVLLTAATVTLPTYAAGDKNMTTNQYNRLTPEEEQIILHKGTEKPFSGKYDKFSGKGTYICKRCNSPLYKSDDKFQSRCGWPSFDDEIPGRVRRQPDADGRRTEILCANCGAHLGHVFSGEQLTEKNLRHCVNSLAIRFVPDGEKLPAVITPPTREAYFAGGCFWGVEYMFEKQPGVIEAVSGYMGGSQKNPTYEAVCRKDTGHYETVRVTYDPAKTDFETLAKFFFEIHDPAQADGQGPDIGPQYRPVIFVGNDTEKAAAEKLIDILKKKKIPVATSILPVSEFWPAEEYHQNYYTRHNKKPYCHRYTRRF